MRRLVYSPEMKVYIQPSGVGKDGKPLPPIDISSDIIDGTIERKTNDISTARFTVQGRRIGKKNETDSTTSLLLSQTIRPMDRIVVYLKKTKPILVFSGYLDLVPLIQFVPEPVTIEASCTLKRLEFTYWDPTLPNVMQYLLKSGFIVQNTDSGFNTYQVPGSDGVPFEKQDTGFSKLLSFLLIDVGGWKPGSVFIEPLPQEWLKLAESLFKEIIKDDHTWDAAKAFIESWLDLGGTGGGDGGGGDGTIDSQDYREVYKATGDGWETVTSTFFGDVNDVGTNGSNMANGEVVGHDSWGFGECSINPTVPEPQMLFCSLKQDNSRLGYPLGTVIEVRHLSSGKTIKVRKKDNGGGGKGLNGHRRSIDLCPASARALNHNGLMDVEWRLYDATKNPSPDDVANQSSRSGDRTPSAGKGAVVKEKLTVYIQASGAPDYDAGSNENAELGRMDGYQKIDQFGRSYSSVSRMNAIRKNVEIVGRIQKYVQDKIDAWKNGAGKNWTNPGDQDIEIITFNSATKDSNLHGTDSDGWAGDIYLEIDHSDSERNNDYCYYSVPSPNCNKNGLQNPNKFFSADFGYNWQRPSSVSGRDLISGTQSKGLHKNSNNFITSLKNAKNKDKAKANGNGLTMSKVNVSKPLGPGLNKSDAAAYAWSGDIPGFYYSKASVCAYLQLPNKSDDTWIPETDDWAWQIAEAIWDYYFNVKIAKNPRGGGQSTANNATVGGSGNTSESTATPEEIISKVLSSARKYLGTPYSWGGGDKNGPTKGTAQGANTVGFDCSGLTLYAWAQVGVTLPHYTDSQANMGINVPLGQEQPGDLLFYAGGNDPSGAKYHHVTMYTGNGNVIQAPQTGDVVKEGKRSGHSLARRYVQMADGSISGTAGDGTSNPSNPDLTAQNFMNAAFNVGFMFPGSMVDSLLLRGQRALENDVPLLDSVREITIASMRNFASLPNGDFIAWYPDYFNIARRNPWLRISAAELKKCTIDLSDKSLATHVYILGNPWGLGTQPSANSDWYEKLAGTGVVTIEQPKILDSFLNTEYKSSKTGERIVEAFDSNSQYPSLEFLEKYGARPYKEQNLTIRHPVMEFFYAYHTFIQKWSEQFISTAEFTFMPELFPGMIIEIPNYQDSNPLGGITFYVQDVTHNCSYENGFNTTATLVAPGYSDYSDDDTRSPLGLVPVKVPGEAFREPVKYRVKPKVKNGKVTGRNANNRVPKGT
jgi:cell wall-associated NlpC family hydrolase